VQAQYTSCVGKDNKYHRAKVFPKMHKYHDLGKVFPKMHFLDRPGVIIDFNNSVSYQIISRTGTA
jgi:hypothetical protein